MRTLRVPKRAVGLLIAFSMAGAVGPSDPSTHRGAGVTQADTSLSAAIRARIKGLVFDSVLGAADAQPLLVKDRRRYGFAKIEPETGAYRVDTNALARGRIIARISSEAGYAPLGLGRGTNWWWIDKQGGRWRSVVYSEALNATAVTVLDSLRSHPRHRWGQSIARFVFVDTIVAFWGGTRSHCVPSLNLPDAYWRLEAAQPWRTPGAPR